MLIFIVLIYRLFTFHDHSLFKIFGLDTIQLPSRSRRLIIVLLVFAHRWLLLHDLHHKLLSWPLDWQLWATIFFYGVLAVGGILLSGSEFFHGKFHMMLIGARLRIVFIHSLRLLFLLDRYVRELLQQVRVKILHHCIGHDLATLFRELLFLPSLQLLLLV